MLVRTRNNLLKQIYISPLITWEDVSNNISSFLKFTTNVCIKQFNAPLRPSEKCHDLCGSQVYGICMK